MTSRVRYAINYIIRSIVLCSLTLAFSYCSSPSSGGGGYYPPPDENPLLETFLVDLAKLDPNIELGPCYAIRSSETSEYVYWIIPATSRTSSDVALVKLYGIRFMSRNQVELARNDCYVSGVVRKVNASRNTNSCLAANETGFFLGIEQMPFDEISLVMADSLTLTTDQVSLPAADIIMTDYQANSMWSFFITIKNRGAAPASLEMTFPRIVLFSRAGIPAHWGFAIFPDTLGKILLPNQECGYSNLMYSDSTLGTVHYLPDFKDTSTEISLLKTPAPLAPKPVRRTTEEYEAELVKYHYMRNEETRRSLQQH